MILISFDIDGTLTVGDPPGILPVELVRTVKEQGCLVGSCSDRPISAQRAIWASHQIEVDFTVSKHMLDKRPALEAGFEFLWPHEAAEMPWVEGA